jgi:7-cyano-7-deazaguanine synthase
MEKNKCLVLVSGGQDSATCLSWASKTFEEVFAISFDYGQKHVVELDSAIELAKIAGCKRHFIRKFDILEKLGGSALIGQDNREPIGESHPLNSNLPASFVPGRNYILLGIAGAQAFQYGINHLVTGTCQTDFSGYPDCRYNSMKAIELALSLCLDFQFIIHTPLMWLTKAETVKFMLSLGTLQWYKYTHTCYEGKVPPCGKCPSCQLRAKGFEEAGIPDPLLAE